MQVYDEPTRKLARERGTIGVRDQHRTRLLDLVGRRVTREVPIERDEPDLRAPATGSPFASRTVAMLDGATRVGPGISSRPGESGSTSS